MAGVEALQKGRALFLWPGFWINGSQVQRRQQRVLPSLAVACMREPEALLILAAIHRHQDPAPPPHRLAGHWLIGVFSLLAAACVGYSLTVVCAAAVVVLCRLLGLDSSVQPLSWQVYVAPAGAAT